MATGICACGCGKEFEIHWNLNKRCQTRFIRGHHFKNKHHSEESKVKMGIIHKAERVERKKRGWFKNKETERLARLNLSNAKKAEKNPMWKGDEVKYNALHDWIKANKPKLVFCEVCKEKCSTDLANISGSYKRDITDYNWLCRKCHMISDGRINKRDSLGRFCNDSIC